MHLPDIASMLARTPDAMEALLADLPGDWLHRNDGPGTWSAYDVVGHLIHGEATDWIPRTRTILEYGPERTFTTFDREAMLGAEPDPVGVVLDRFRTARQANLAELASFHLGDADLQRRGRHPEFGEVTLGQMLATWVAHDLTHLAQVGEVLARRYRDDVGPWRAYLPALDRIALAE